MLILINEAKEGMVLKKPVYNGANILIEKETVLNKNIIEKIKKFNVSEIYIEKEEIEVMLEKENKLKETFKADYNEALTEIKNVVENIQKGNIEISKIEGIVDDTINNLELDRDILLSLLEGSKQENYIFQHSINTVAISLVIGMALDYSPEKLKLLGKGALLHDIGMLKLPKNILENEDALSKEELDEIKKHTFYGLEMLKDLEQDVLNIIKYHHEKMDGTGYPEGLKGEAIPEMARIVTIADVYSALTENRGHRVQYHYYDAMKIVMQSSIKMLDARILKEFLKYMPVYPINTLVLLSNSKEGKVVKANENPFRPVVDVIEDNGKINRIDLMEEENLTKYITGVKK